MLKIVTTYGRTRYVNAYQILEVETNLQGEVVIVFANNTKETVNVDLHHILAEIDAILYK